MNNVYMHGQRQGFLPCTTDGNPIGFGCQSLASDFERVILTLPQVLDIFDNLDLVRRTMALTDAATALQVSEVLALKWNDLDLIDHLIQVRPAYESLIPSARREASCQLSVSSLLASRQNNVRS